MSVEATSWALQQQALTDPGARAVLFGLANHANHEGRHAFPSVDLLCRYTGLGRRTVISKLKLLQEKGLIRRGNQKVAAAIIDRADRRPVVYDLALGVGIKSIDIGDEQSPDVPESRDAENAPRENEPGATDASRDGNGVQMTTPRGARAAPETSLTNPHTLSGADEGESIFERAARQTDDGQPVETVNRRQPMTLDWQPESAAWDRACFDRGLAADVDHRQALIDFREHYAAEPARTATPADWTRRFARWVYENLQRQPARHNASGGSHDCPTADRSRDDRTEREAVRQQLANPNDTSWADGWWPEDDTATGADAGAGQPGVHPAGGDFSEDLGERVPECGPAQPGPAGTGAGAGPVAGATDPANGRAGDEQFEASGEYLAADDPGAGLDAGAYPGGLRHADDW